MFRSILFLSAGFLVLTVSLWGADVSGKWICALEKKQCEDPGTGGGTAGIIGLNLKADGSKLTGTAQVSSSNGYLVKQVSGAIKGDTITFSLEGSAYTAHVKGDSLTFSGNTHRVYVMKKQE